MPARRLGEAFRDPRQRSPQRVLTTGNRGKDQTEWDKLYDQFQNAGGDWLQSEFAMVDSTTRSQEKQGSWKTFSKKVALLKIAQNFSF